MSNQLLEVREIQNSDISHIVDYWMNADDAYLQGMGVDSSKIPPAEEWEKMLTLQINQPYGEKQSYCIIWLAGGQPIGHTNINKIIMGQEAYMHLHIWKPEERKKGRGTSLLKMSIPYYFRNYRLRNLYCEPYALNPAPNKTLEKLGFRFIKQHTCIPGWLNFEQPVNRWELSYEQYQLLA